MPHSTARYPFERQMAIWVGSFVEGDTRETIVVAVNEALEMTVVRTADLSPDALDEAKDAVRRMGGAIVAYHPFDMPDYFMLQWHGLSRATAEYLAGAAFSPDDLPGSDASPPAETGVFPTDWTVVF